MCAQRFYDSHLLGKCRWGRRPQSFQWEGTAAKLPKDQENTDTYSGNDAVIIGHGQGLRHAHVLYYNTFSGRTYDITDHTLAVLLT